MSLKEDFDTLDENEVQKAFDQSAKVVFDGKKLHPWTISRHSAALSMGNSVVSAVGINTQNFLTTGVCDNVFRDVVIVLWLCSLSDDEVLELNCTSNLKTEMGKAFAWAEKVGLVYGSKPYIEGLALMDQIVRNVYVSFFGMEGNSPAKRLSKKAPGFTRAAGKAKSRSMLHKPRIIP